jgi:hypothetical protein
MISVCMNIASGVRWKEEPGKTGDATSDFKPTWRSLLIPGIRGNTKNVPRSQDGMGGWFHSHLYSR